MPATPPPTAPAPLGLPPDRLARRRRQRRVFLLASGASYLVDALLLAALWLAGATGPGPAGAALVGGLLQCGVVGWLQHTRRNERMADPYLVTPQLIWGSAVQLFIAWCWPEVAVLVVMVLFIVFAFAALAQRPARLALAWTLCSAGIALVMLRPGASAALPHATVWQAGVSAAWMALVLARCIFVGSYGAAVRHQLGVRSRQLAEATTRLHDLAMRDSLTGVLNRRAVMESLAASLAGGPVAVVLCDLDHFKRVNDRHGHQAGDQVICRFATLAGATLRAADRLGRYGGEEFLVVIAGDPAGTGAAAGSAAALAAAERLRDRLREANWTDIAPGLSVTVSMGIAASRPDESVEELLRRADQALYAAKAAGRDTVRLA